MIICICSSTTTEYYLNTTDTLVPLFYPYRRSVAAFTKLCGPFPVSVAKQCDQMRLISAPRPEGCFQDLAGWKNLENSLHRGWIQA